MELGYINVTPEIKERSDNFFELYENEILIKGTNEKTILGGNRAFKTCRFCNKTQNEVSFRNDAHVIPQFMGNRKLLSFFECDECNEKFSLYEDSFAKFIGISRTFSQIKGNSKNKIPKHKDHLNGLEFYKGIDSMEMKVIENQDVVKIDEDKKKIYINTHRKPYVPLHIAKVIYKLAISLLKEEDLMAYELMRQILVSDKHDSGVKDNQLFNAYCYFIPGPPYYSVPVVTLFNKREKYKEYPSFQKIIVLHYANYMFQMSLWGKNDSHFYGQDVRVPVFPLLIDYSYFQKYGMYQCFDLNLSSSEKKKNEEHRLTLGFDKITKIKTTK